MLQARDIIDTLINGEAPYSAGFLQKRQPSAQPELFSRYEGVTIMVGDIIHAVIEEFLGDFGVSADRLTATERQQIVHELDNRGVFLEKCSISEVAKQLGCSEATIYRYLQ